MEVIVVLSVLVGFFVFLLFMSKISKMHDPRRAPWVDYNLQTGHEKGENCWCKPEVDYSLHMWRHREKEIENGN